MNILWIMADQMRADCAGFMGHPIVRTPNLDSLASRSVVFEQAFAQSPLCSPSRTCLFTGRYVHSHGVWWNGVTMPRKHILLPEILRQTGYHTGIIGKLHFAPPQSSYGFNYKELHEELLLDGTDLSAYDKFFKQQNLPAENPDRFTSYINRLSEVGLCHLDENIEETRWAADRACAFLQEQAKTPFFLFTSFIRPHSPYNPLPRFADLYTDAEIPPPSFNKDEWCHIPARVRATAESWGWDNLSLDDFIEVRRHYYALCSQVDENIGRVLSCLEELKLTDSTIIVFTSDHGDFLGEHGLLYKEHLYDGSLHVPLIIYDPRRKKTGLRYSGLIETIDIMPTLLEMINLRVPDQIQGKSLVPVIDNPNLSHRDTVFSEWTTHTVNKNVRSVLNSCICPSIKSVRTDQWKYIHYVGEPGEIYNIQNDPEERINLFNDPVGRIRRQKMEELILDWLIVTEDTMEPCRMNPYFSSLKL